MGNQIITLNTGRRDRLSQRIKNAKWSYATRRIPVDIDGLHIDDRKTPKAGDLVLAKVKRLGQHKRIELANGRRARMFVEDDIVVVYGNRYAPDHFEAIVPEDLGPCHLAAAGGIAGQMVYKHAAIKKPTAIVPAGILTHANGNAVNLIDYTVTAHSLANPLPPVIAVVGGSMNTGKTTTAASLVHGLTLAGFDVTAGKVTGTGSGCDVWHIMDAGARRVVDFMDFGYPSTYLLTTREVEGILESLLSHLNRDNPDFIILEVADGLLQPETSNLINSDKFQNLVDGVLYTATEALGAVRGVEMLQHWGVPVFCVSGMISRSPLGVREVLDAVDIPVLGRGVLADPAIRNHVATWLDRSSPDARARGNG